MALGPTFEEQVRCMRRRPRARGRLGWSRLKDPGLDPRRGAQSGGRERRRDG